MQNHKAIIFLGPYHRKRLKCLMLQFCQKKLVQAGLSTFNSWLLHFFLMVNPLTIFLLGPHPKKSDQNISFCSLPRKMARRGYWTVQQKKHVFATWLLRPFPKKGLKCPVLQFGQKNSAGSRAIGHSSKKHKTLPLHFLLDTPWSVHSMKEIRPR